jgi:hypothetical protein
MESAQLCSLHRLSDSLTPKFPGWRIEKESDEKEEWALLSGFENVDHHMAFAKTAEFEKYRALVECVDGFELKHMRSIEGL